MFAWKSFRGSLERQCWKCSRALLCIGLCIFRIFLCTSVFVNLSLFLCICLGGKVRIRKCRKCSSLGVSGLLAIPVLPRPTVRNHNEHQASAGITVTSFLLFLFKCTCKYIIFLPITLPFRLVSRQFLLDKNKQRFCFAKISDFMCLNC